MRLFAQKECDYGVSPKYVEISNLHCQYWLHGPPSNAGPYQPKSTQKKYLVDVVVPLHVVGARKFRWRRVLGGWQLCQEGAREQDPTPLHTWCRQVGPAFQSHRRNRTRGEGASWAARRVPCGTASSTHRVTCLWAPYIGGFWVETTAVSLLSSLRSRTAAVPLPASPNHPIKHEVFLHSLSPRRPHRLLPLSSWPTSFLPTGIATTASRKHKISSRKVRRPRDHR
jgi:hypothetical protein